MKNKLLTILIAIVSILVLLSTIAIGCKTGTAETTTAVETTAAATTATATTAAATTAAAETVDPASFKGKFTLWTQAVEFSQIYVPEFNKTYPNIKVDVTFFNSGELATKVLSTISAGSGVPDLFTGEISLVKRFVDQDIWENLSVDPYNAEPLVADHIKYSTDIARDKDGNLRAMDYQATPGAVYYRRSMAKKYFGTDDPVEIGKMMSTMEGFINMGKTIKEKSGGKDSLLAGWGDLRYMELGVTQRTSPLISDGKIIISKAIQNYIDDAKTIRDLGLDAKEVMWTPEWMASINGNVFAYIAPAWFMVYVIEPTAKVPAQPQEGVNYSWGDWAACASPYPYYWGGTYLGMYKDSPRKDLVWEFLKFFASDNFLTWLTLKGDYVSNTKIVSSLIKDTYRECMGGQNYQVFYDEGQKISGDYSKLITPYDDQIYNMLDAAITQYVEGKLTKEQALKQYETDVQSAFPEYTQVVVE